MTSARLRTFRIHIAFTALIAVLFSLQAFAIGDQNLLVKPKPLPEGQGYVLFSIVYSPQQFAEEPPCVHINLVPGPGKGKKLKARSLSTTTGWHCDSAWKDRAAVVRTDGSVRVLILQAVPAGEYDVRGGSVQFTSGQRTYFGELPVTGIRAVQVSGDQIAYAGSFLVLKSMGEGVIRAENNWKDDSDLLKNLRPDIDALSKSMPTWE